MIANKKSPYRAAVILFAVYCAIMIWLLFGQRVGFWKSGGYLENLRSGVNLIPFKTISEQFLTVVGGGYKARHCIINLVGNVITFLPFGLLLPVLHNSLTSLRRFTLLMTVMIFSIELVQLFTLLGSFDIDDYILNIIGTSAGFGINRAVCSIIKKQKSDRH